MSIHESTDSSSSDCSTGSSDWDNDFGDLIIVSLMHLLYIYIYRRERERERNYYQYQKENCFVVGDDFVMIDVDNSSPFIPSKSG